MRSLAGRLSRLASPARSVPLLPLCRTALAPRRWTTSSPAAAAAASASSLALFEAAFAPHAQAPSWPREILLLCGAPGAGKGSMTAIIKAERDLHEVIEMSSLLTSPEMEARKASGALIGDAEVTAALFSALSSPKYAGGVIVDGFPRTAAQAEVCWLLAERLAARAHAAGAPPPRFSSLVIYVTEEESVRRQLNRGHELQHYNAMVADVGVGEPLPVRPTDVSEEAARRRWRIFRHEVYAAVQTIKHRFPFHYIDATCSREEMVRRIKAELAYRPEEELNAETYALMRGIQTASAVTKSARSALVSRINAYQKENPASFREALQIISLNFMHIIQRQGEAGAGGQPH